MTKKRLIVIAAFLAMAGAALWFALAGPENEEARDILNGRELLVLLDGEEQTDAVISPETADGLRVIIRLNDTVLADLPFGDEHTVEIVQKSGRNKIRITADAVYMEEADCPGHDCVDMGRYTRDNWETRQMIVCLPHRLSVQVTD